MMLLQNTVDIQQVKGENYTCVSYESLQLRLPGSEDVVEGIIRDYPVEPLIRRDYEEIEKLRGQLFFKT